MRRDIHSSVDVVQSLAPGTYTAPTVGHGVDLKGYNAAQAAIVVGVVSGTNVTFTFHVQESDDDSPGSYSNVAEDDLQGASKVPVVDAGAQVLRIGYLGNKRWIRVAITSRTGSTPVLIGTALIVRGLPGLAPIPE